MREFQEYPLNATLVDFSPTALDFARKNAEKNGVRASFTLADVLRLPFPDESFDIVWNEGVNEHFDREKRQLVFSEMARVCKVGGQVIVIVPNTLNLPYRLWKKVLER
jgi:ubiquinone/menaquinone biosynthesis C-methylase UbiE